MAVLGATSLTGCNSIPSFIAGGSLMLFQQTAAPTSWTKETTHNNKALRVVTGTATPGGSTAFSTVFASRPISGTVGNHTLTTPQIPSHAHPNGSAYVNVIGVSNPTPANAGNSRNIGGGPTTGTAGSDGVHDHPFSATALDFAVQYVDIIICSTD
jgi:hypothetical protein